MSLDNRQSPQQTGSFATTPAESIAIPAQPTKRIAPWSAFVTMACCVGLLLLMPATPGHAAASEEEETETSAAPDALQSAKDLIDKENYQAALKSLMATTKKQPDNADAWNLLGYSQRKLGMLPDAATAYEQALTIDPEHKGALEYQGELFLMLGNQAAAKVNHDKLTQLCPDSCPELQQLDNAIKGGNW